MHTTRCASKRTTRSLKLETDTGFETAWTTASVFEEAGETPVRSFMNLWLQTHEIPRLEAADFFVVVKKAKLAGCNNNRNKNSAQYECQHSLHPEP